MAHRTRGEVVLQAVIVVPQEGAAAEEAVADTEVEADMEVEADTEGEDTFQTSHSITIGTTLPQEVSRSPAEAGVTLEAVVAEAEDLLTQEINSIPLHLTAICPPP